MTTPAAPPNWRPTLVGVLNLSPESNVRGSVVTEHDAILEKAAALTASGSDIVELGARSISSTDTEVSDAEEQARLLPVLQAVKSRDRRVSVDTWSADTAIAALDAGADIINCTAADPPERLYRAVAAANASLILTFMPYANAYAMRKSDRVDYGPEEILAYFRRGKAAAEAAGCDSVIADPNAGIFHATVDEYDKIAYQLQAMDTVPLLHEMGLPVMLYCARKESLTSRVIYAALLLKLRVDYIRIHEPEIARRLIPTGGRPPAP